LPCEVCSFPVFSNIRGDGTHPVPLICSTCAMLATGRRYHDGSGPQDRCSAERIAWVTERYNALTA
jgi:hypothetical protein